MGQGKGGGREEGKEGGRERETDPESPRQLHMLAETKSKTKNKIEIQNIPPHWTCH